MSFPATFLGINWDSGLKSAGSSTSHLLLSTAAFVTEPF